MSIEIVREPDDGPGVERCCFCRKTTPFWTTDAKGKVGRNSVACCEECAKRAFPDDVPSKAVWCRREGISHHAWSAEPLKPPTPEEVIRTSPAARHTESGATTVTPEDPNYPGVDKSWGSSQIGEFFIIRRREDGRGFIVSDKPKGGCNVLPGASWAKTYKGAEQMLHLYVASKGDSTVFWALLHAIQLGATP